jgi:DHA2 family multidrug resistance protein
MTDIAAAPVPRAGAATPAATAAPGPPPGFVVSKHPLIGTAAVLLGAVIATLDSRITTFGLADVEGAVHATFDQGAWIPTALTVGQMMIALAAPWLGLAFGTRRILLVSCVVFGLSNFLLPFSPNLGFVLAFQAISGLSSGTFIPLTLGFVLLNLPPRLVVYGVAAYAVNLELSLNVAASIEGWFDTNWSWSWIFWDTAILAVPMLICVCIGVPNQPTNKALLGKADWPGMLYGSLALSLIYAALDQGNRLDWLGSGLVVGLLATGGFLLVMFVLREATYAHPWLDLNYATSGNIPLLALYIAFFRMVILSSAYIIPQFLITVQGYRAIEVGSALVWIALPQFLLGPVVATILRFVDPRIPLALGFTLVAIACYLSGQLTAAWTSPDFILPALIQAVGQTMALTSIVWFALNHLNPIQIVTFSAILQTGRLFGAEVGSAFIQTFIRMREQVYSNLIGLHVFSGASQVAVRLQDYVNAVIGHSVGAPAAQGRALVLLATAVRKQAYVLAYIDGFLFLSFAVIVALMLMLLLRPAPEQSVLKTLLLNSAPSNPTRSP